MHVSSRRGYEADGKEMQILWSSQRVGLETAKWVVVGCGVRKRWTARSAPQRHHEDGCVCVYLRPTGGRVRPDKRRY